jgi:hypothetical protein
MDIFPILKHALLITFFVFSMMLLVDFVNIATKGATSRLMQGGRWRQNTLASFLGSTPGCLGAFMDVTLYVHGMISFGAVTGGMIATSGDEAFIMLSQFPGTAVLLFVLLLAALMGIVPESGPHLIIVMMYAKGLIPFSVLLTSSFVQDGHGMLPLLSYSIKDSILIKVFNFAFGIGIGFLIYAFGV